MVAAILIHWPRKICIILHIFFSNRFKSSQTFFYSNEQSYGLGGLLCHSVIHVAFPE